MHDSIPQGRRAWIGLGALTIAALLASMDLSILFMASPALSADLQPSGAELLWIMDIYGFVMAGLLLTMGTLGDRIGRRKLLLAGAVAFGIASAVAAYSTDPQMLIAARALLGFGGATLAPSTLALIRTMFTDPGKRRIAVGIWTGAFTGGIVVGPIIGGLLLERFWWGSVFLINIPVMAVLLVLGPLLLPESKNPRPGRFDPVSVVLSLGSVLPVVYGIKKIAEDAAIGVEALVTVAAGVVVGVFFIRRQFVSTEPLIDVRLFRIPAFGASVGANTMVTFASAGTGALAIQYIQLVLGYRPFTAALWLIPTMIGTVIGIVAANVLVRWIRPGTVVGLGVAVAALGFGLLASVADTNTAIEAIVACYAVLTLGVGMAVTLSIDLVLGSAPAERAGSASATSETGAEFGGALGIAVLGSVSTVVYGDGMRGAMPDAVPSATADVASGSLGGATEAALTLPDEVAGPLLEAAYQAFSDGLTVAAITGAVVLAVTAVVAAVALRNTPRAPSSDSDDHGGSLSGAQESQDVVVE